MLDSIRAIPRKVGVTSRFLLRDDAVVVYWATEGILAANWGDKLNPYLVERISGKRVVFRADVYPVSSPPIYYCIGSHLASACRNPNAIVWGSGFISSNIEIAGRPRAIHAVRGWLSDERLRKKGVSTPGIVGDPALLLPRIFSPKRTEERRQLGIIPHCYEWNEPFFTATRAWEDARVIDICGGIEEVVEQIVACDRIVSSSLHGIICADAYGIPALWLHASDKPLGDGFKFRDYFSSVGRPDRDPIYVSAETCREALEDRFFDYEIEIDLDALWSAFPLRPEIAKWVAES
jgi:pyruvyltransferase